MKSTVFPAQMKNNDQLNLIRRIQVKYINTVKTREKVNMKNSKKAKKIDPNTFAIGGQALIEGVMFKSSDKLSMSVRNPKGKIITKIEKTGLISEKYKILGLPVVRGVVNLVEMMGIGFKALTYSAEISSDEGEKLSKKESAFATVFAIIFAVGLFIVLPLFITKMITTNKGILFNLIDGIFRIVIFVAYLLIISLMPDIRRVFQYHGAEHKTINCYEKIKDPKRVTVNEAMKYSTLHPRCGTSFLIFVLIISILVFSIFNFQSTAGKILSRLLLLPLIAGISYEVLKFSAKHEKNIFMKAVIFPGLMIQKITTKEPDKKQLEVAIAAFRKHF